MSHIAILHGWSDSSASFEKLSAFLAGNGRAPVHLADYFSREDDVCVEDVAIRMQAVVSRMLADGTLTAPFDLIVHSTGGLVAREWITRFYPNGIGCPVKRLIMLAPANFGSALAATGKSMLGRIVKGFDNWFEVGKLMLDQLELASAYQWDLACRDLLDPVGQGAGPYGADRIMPFVIIGTRGYRGDLRSIANEPGADGTIRPAAADLNAIGLTIDFSIDPANPVPTLWHRRNAVDIPLAVLPDRDHGSICDPAAPSGLPGIPDRLGGLILDALGCAGDAAAYGAIAAEWEAISEATAALADSPAARQTLLDGANADANSLHQYFQVVTAVVDNHGRPVPDYFVEFYCPHVAGDAEMVAFHREVLDDVHVNKLDASRRCFFADRTDLFAKYYGRFPNAPSVAASISAADLGRNVHYFANDTPKAHGALEVHNRNDTLREGLPGRLRRNRTHLVKIIIPRRPVDGVFILK